jgi:hypothetical protein
MQSLLFHCSGRDALVSARRFVRSLLATSDETWDSNLCSLQDAGFSLMSYNHYLNIPFLDSSNIVCNGTITNRMPLRFEDFGFRQCLHTTIQTRSFLDSTALSGLETISSVSVIGCYFSSSPTILSNLSFLNF